MEKYYIKMNNMYLGCITMEDSSATNEFISTVKFYDGVYGAVFYKEDVAKAVLEKLAKIGFCNLTLERVE